MLISRALIWCATVRRQYGLPWSAFRLEYDTLIDSMAVRDLRIFIIFSNKCGYTNSGLLLAASRPYVSYASSGDMFHHLSIRVWSLPLFWRGSTMVLLLWQACRTTVSAKTVTRSRIVRPQTQTRRPALVRTHPTHPVGLQTLSTGFQLRAWVRAEISTRGHPSGCERWATTSSALCLLGRLDRAGYATLYTGRPRLCRGRSACLEHSA